MVDKTDKLTDPERDVVINLFLEHLDQIAQAPLTDLDKQALMGSYVRICNKIKASKTVAEIWEAQKAKMVQRKIQLNKMIIIDSPSPPRETPGENAAAD